MQQELYSPTRVCPPPLTPNIAYVDGQEGELLKQSKGIDLRWHAVNETLCCGAHMLCCHADCYPTVAETNTLLSEQWRRITGERRDAACPHVSRTILLIVTACTILYQALQMLSLPQMCTASFIKVIILLN
jgi:hypothetical protein